MPDFISELSNILSMIHSTKKRNLPLILISLFIIGFTQQAIAQYQSVIIGGGVAPLHRSAQSDFTKLKMPRDIFVMYRRGNIGIRADYLWNSAYQKENFSFTYDATELSLVYNLKQILGSELINPYIRIGASKWNTTFTTEGYPGINDYEFKIESDKGYGLISAAGIDYVFNNISIGLEGQYALNGKAQFIAGGFEPQPLATGNFRLMIMAKYSLPINISSKGGYAITCPKF